MEAEKSAEFVQKISYRKTESSRRGAGLTRETTFSARSRGARLRNSTPAERRCNADAADENSFHSGGQRHAQGLLSGASSDAEIGLAARRTTRGRFFCAAVARREVASGPVLLCGKGAEGDFRNEKRQRHA